MSDILSELNQAMSAVVTDVTRSLVTITNGHRDRGPYDGAGAGVVWTRDGVIVTNAHVVQARRRGPWRRGWRWGRGFRRGGDEAGGRTVLHVTLPDGREFEAAVLAVDTDHDVAALKIEADDLTPITPGDSQAMQAGHWVFALGHPWGVQAAATGGVLIAQGLDLPELRGDRDWLAVGLRLRPGNSGGPLVDSRGRLIGLNTVMTGPEVGLAVPVHVVTEFLNRVLAKASVPADTQPANSSVEYV